jgi:O-antigen/teichoic acid export membrane protein
VRVRRSILNFASNALLIVVTMVVGLKAMPYLIGWLGDERFGGNRIVTTGYGYLTLLELGLGGAIGPLLARAVGQGDEPALRATMAAGARAYLKVSLATVAVGLALTPIIPWFAEDMSSPGRADLRRAWALGLVSFLTLPLLPMRTVVEARQLGYVVNLLLTGQYLLVTALSLTLARAGWGVTGQAAAQAAGSWAFCLAVSAGVCRGHPGLVRSVLTTPTAPETRRALRSLSWPALLLNVSGRVSVLTDVVVVSKMLSVKQVASFENTQKLASLGQTVLQAVGGASWAALAELYARREHETFNRRLVEMSRMVAVLAIVGLVPVVAYNRAFFRIWDLPDTPYGGDLLIVLASVNALLLAEQSLWAWCFLATGNLRHVVGQAAAAAAVNVAVSLAATRAYGLTGPLIGSTVAFVGVGMWALPLQLRRVFGTPTGPLLRAVGLPAVAGSAAAWGLWVFARDHEPATFAGLALAMGLSALAMLALSAAVLLTPEERALWRHRLALMRPRVGRPAA